MTAPGEVQNWQDALQPIWAVEEASLSHQLPADEAVKRSKDRNDNTNGQSNPARDIECAFMSRPDARSTVDLDLDDQLATPIVAKLPQAIVKYDNLGVVDVTHLNPDEEARVSSLANPASKALSRSG